MSAVSEAHENVAGNLISPKDPVRRISGQFVNKTRNFPH